MSQIQYLLLQRLKTELTTALQTNVSNKFQRANEVKIGRFQDSPLVTRVYVSISTGSQEDPDLTDGIVSLREIERIDFYVPAREIGGGMRWWRRGMVVLGCFYVLDALSEEKAAENAFEVMGRLMHTLNNINVSDLRDDYHERAHTLFVFGETFFESGGNNQYIWRGKVKWQCLTEIEP